MLDLKEDKQIKRILVMKWGALGDLVIATALFTDMRNAFPDAEISLQTLPQYADLFDHDPRFDHIRSPDIRRRNGVFHWLKDVLDKQYDLVIDLQTNDRSRMYISCWLMTTRAPRWRVGNHNVFPYNCARKNTNREIHAFEIQKETLQSIGIEVLNECPTLFPGEHHVANVDKLMREYGLHPGRFAIFFPGSQAKGVLKRWGSRRYAELAEILLKNHVDNVVLLGGPDDIEECLAVEQYCSSSQLTNLCGQTKILDIVPFCDYARLIVSNDTGPAHIASATSTPMLVICGPTDPARVKPLGKQVVALQADIDCANCYQTECSHHSCMQMLTPETVMQDIDARIFCHDYSQNQVE